MTDEEKAKAVTIANLAAGRYPQFRWQNQWLKPYMEIDPYTGEPHHWKEQFFILAQTASAGRVYYNQQVMTLLEIEELLKSGHLTVALDWKVEIVARELMKALDER